MTDYPASNNPRVLAARTYAPAQPSPGRGQVLIKAEAILGLDTDLMIKATIVGTEDDLFTDFGNSAFTVKPRVHDRFSSAPTNCFYLFNRVGKSHESVTALKKIALKISSQPIAYHRNIVFVNLDFVYG